VETGRVRILFVTPPGLGHLFPIVPIAWALRVLGCEVRVATCGVSVSAATHAGLPSIDVAGSVNLPMVYSRFKTDFGRSFSVSIDDYTNSLKIQSSDRCGADENIFSALGDLMVDGVIQVAREWSANLIIHTPDAAAAPIASTKLSIPSVFLSIGLAHTPEFMFHIVKATFLEEPPEEKLVLQRLCVFRKIGSSPIQV
jgi:hypothetical protein